MLDVYVSLWEWGAFKQQFNTFYLFLSSFFFSSSFFLFCYNVIHLRWMTVVAHRHLSLPVSITSSALYPNAAISSDDVLRKPIAVSCRSTRLTFQYPNPRSSVIRDPTGSPALHFSRFPPSYVAPPCPHRPRRPMCPTNNDIFINFYFN